MSAENEYVISIYGLDGEKDQGFHHFAQGTTPFRVLPALQTYGGMATAPADNNEILISLVAAAGGYFARKAVDLAADLVKDWILKRRPHPGREVVIFGPNGERVSVVEQENDVQIIYKREEK